MKKLIIQFLKFGIVGAINTFSSWIVYYPLVFFNVNYLLANTIAYFISSIIGFILNKIWVFKKKEEVANSVLKYYIVYISSYFLNMGSMYLFVNVLEISEYIAPILVLCITVPYNFIFNKIWVFRQKKHKEMTPNAKDIHTFAICAYKESPYLEECIKSIINQKVNSNCIIATSTPSKYIEDLAKKYKIKYFIKNGKSDIQDDWKFAYNCADTKLVTIAHQDDVYKSNYLQEILEKYDENGLIYCMEYNTYKNGIEGVDKNSKIKVLLKLPLRIKFFSKIKAVKVLTLSFGNSINCPSVVYNKEKLGDAIFSSDLKFALDWDIFLKIAKMKGRIVYIPKKLINYRIHEQATTKEFIVNNKRQEEDIAMFNKIWPKFITKIIMKIYVKSYDTYN